MGLIQSTPRSVNSDPSLVCNATNVTLQSAYELDEEYLPPLEIERHSNRTSHLEQLSGRRIVNIGHILSEYEKVLKHPGACTMGKMKLIKESRTGLITRLHFYCDNCEKKLIISSEPNDHNINSAAAWGCMSVGIGHSQCEELLAVLDIPFMNTKTFAKEVINVKKVKLFKLINKIKGNKNICI